MKIVYLVNGPLTSRWQSYYCLDAVAERYDVSFWDCSQLVEFPNIVSETLHRPYVVSDITFDNLEEHLAQLPKDTIIVPEIVIAPCNYKVFKIVAKYISTAVQLDFWKSPISFNIKSPAIVRNTKESLQQRIEKIVKNKLLTWWWKRHFKTYMFTTDPHAHFALNYPDVEKYHQLEHDTHHRKERYVVYIGQYFPFHSDTQLSEGADVVRLAPSFYNSMNRFFERIENELECKVIIAEHPSAKHTKNPYKGRSIIYGQTAELIRDSIAVCMHFSNSSSFVILYDKPVALLECEAIKETTRFNRHNKEFAKAFGRELVDIDTEVDVHSIFKPVDAQIRSKALSLLLRKGGELNTELFVQYFGEIEKQICRK